MNDGRASRLKASSVKDKFSGGNFLFISTPTLSIDFTLQRALFF